LKSSRASQVTRSRSDSAVRERRGALYHGQAVRYGSFDYRKVLAQDKADKVIVFKYKRRKDSKKMKGHRQPYTEVLVEKIDTGASHGA